MKRYLFFTILSVLFLAVGCTHYDTPEIDVPGPGNTKFPLEEDNYVVPGILQVKLTPEAEEVFNPGGITRGGVSTGVEGMDAIIRQFGVTKIERMFPHGGRHEAKMRKAGLHLWYNVYFDAGESGAMTRAFTGFSSAGDIQVIEPVLKIERSPAPQIIPVTEADIHGMLAQTRASGDVYNYPTNDPFMHFQWHYHNEGTLYRTKAGADINLFEAWKIETGKPPVIVAVIDGGIDYTHPDIAANMWINEAEMNGAEGVDDDDNGYVDDVYGFNFVTMTGAISAHSHGTHVAGTVAAVNNNGVGVAGVAGGNGSPDSGIRLMSCQIFHNSDSTGTDDDEANKNRALTFVYAANNGAVIAQCSWSYGWGGVEVPLLQSDKDAIDYFIENAGKDENGDQTGPMKGGIVIFAAGNDNTGAKVQPASYEKVLSVSAHNADFTKAVYSNYGSWVHVSAPGGGGEYADGTMIFSTLPMGVYGFNLGSSMACPHVSGIAALVVSKFGVNPDGTVNPGFTNDMLWDRLISATNPYIDWFNPVSLPMGIGYINAQKALADPGKVAPDRVMDLSVEWTFEKAVASWRVTADSDAPGGVTGQYRVVISEDNLYGLDFAGLPSEYTPIDFYTTGMNVGDVITLDIPSVVMGRTYYVSVAGLDADGNYSASTTVAGSMIPNRGPVAEDVPQTVSLRKGERRQYKITVHDPEGYPWTYSFDGGSTGASAQRSGDVLTLTFNASGLNPGSYTANLTLADQQGVQTKITIPYSVIFSAPQLLKEFEDVLMQGTGKSVNYNLDDYFFDQDGDPITYSASSSDNSIASATVGAGNVLTVTSTGLGTAVITVTATDTDSSTEASFSVTTRNASQEVDLYPVPVKNDGILNIRMGTEVNGTVDVTIYSTSGARMLNSQVELSNGVAGTLDLSALPTGNYRIVVKYKYLEITRNITKL